MKIFYIISLFFVLSMLKTNAQVQVSLNVDSNPTPELSEWVNRNNLAILTVTNTDPRMEDVEYKIKVEMFKDGDMMLETNNNVASQYIEMGVVTFLADEIIPYSAIEFTNNNFRNHVLQTGMLPAGEYSFCVTLLDLNENIISSPNPECRPMIITDYQMPELIDPINDKQVSTLLVPTIVFNWTPVTPQPSPDLGVKYILEVKEVLSGQSPSQAFHLNTAIIEEEDIMGTQFNWPSDLDAPDETTQYVWSVKPVSASNDNPFQQESNGFVSIQDFTITFQEEKSQSNCECIHPDCENSPLIFSINESNNSVSLTGFSGLGDVIRLNAVVLGGGLANDIQTFYKVTWDSQHTTTDFVHSGIDYLTHEYGFIAEGGHEIPDEICYLFWTMNPVTGYNCVSEYCIEVPIEIKIAINNPGFDCGCLDESIDTSVISFSIPEGSPENTVQLSGLDTFYGNVVACAVPIEDFDNTNVTMHINWDPLHMTETMNLDGTATHTFNEMPNAAINHEILDSVCFDFQFIYPDGSTCRKVYCIDVPNEIFIEANDEEECSCTDLSLTEPELNIFRPEPSNYPRKLSLGGVTAYRDYLLNCNENYSLTTHSMTVTLDWDNEHSEESIVNAGPFVHEYTIEHEIPTEICATFKIEPLYESSEGVSCTTIKCVPVAQNLLDLNIGVGNSALSLGDSFFAGEHVNGQGEFEIVTTTLTGSGPYSGTGTVYIAWLKTDMTVEFTDITIDTASNLVTGFVTAQIHDTAPVFPVAWAIGVTGGINFTHNQAEDIIGWIETNTDQEIDYNPATGAVMPVKVPLGVNFPSGDQLAITEMVFREDKSEFNLVSAKTTPPNWGSIQTVGFKALNIKFHPTSPVWPPERMELVEDITFGNTNGKIHFTLKAPTTADTGCYIEWEETGFSAYGIQLDVNFTREWLIPLPDDGTTQVHVSLIGTGSAWGDFILSGNLEECVISSTIPDATSGVPTNTGAHDFIILANTISYDWSDLNNIPSISFPINYVGETTYVFHGFYLKNMNVKFSPNKMNTPNGDPIEINIDDMIIDNMGLTFKAELLNLITFGNAEVGDMAASIDRIYLEMLASSFKEAGVEGRIAIPVSDGNSLDNSLAYTALFNVPSDPAANNNFQITLNPDQPINADLLNGEMTLDETSNLSGYFDKDKKTFTMDLNGDFIWEDAQIGPVNNVNFEIGFEGVGFDYDTSLTSNKLSFDAGVWSFASPQKKIAKFPVTIENIEYNALTTSGNQLMHGKLNFDVIFNLSKKIGGMTTLGVEAAIKDQSASGGKKFVPEFIGGIIDSIAIHADMSAVKINGAIGFRSNDVVFGDGFIGTLAAEFKSAGIKVDALAEFGNTNYLHTSRYRYWRVEANAMFPSPGITFLPGIAFRGFGGGAFNNMEATLAGTTYTFKPKKSSLGFRVKAVIATTPKEETFNADVGLLGMFSGSGGLTYIGFTGDFYVAAGFDKRADAKIIGGVSVDYDFPQKHFNMTANVSVNADPISTPSPMNLVLDINGKTNDWYFKFGEPAHLNVVNVFGVSLNEYLMFGNKIPYPGGFSSSFRNKYHNAVGVYPSIGAAGTGGVGNNTKTGKGFAMGIGFEFDKSGEVKLTKYNNNNKKHVLNFDLAAGAELHLSFMEYLGSCNGNSPIGINGWRAKGSLGMYGIAGAGVRKYKKNGSIKWTKTIASLSAGAWITGEFPNPYYVAGAITGNVNIFDLINFSVNQSFEKGTKCSNGGASTGAVVTQGDAAADQQNALIQYIHPNNSMNFPIDAPLIVKYGLNIDEVFDVSEQQDNGTVEMRTFKMIVSKNLKIKNDNTGAWTNEFIGINQNNLGEYLYTVSELTNMTAVAQTLSFPSGGGAGGLSIAQANNTGVYAAPSGFAPVSQPLQQMTAVPAGLVTYPPQPPSDDYDDLPPESDPIINSLIENKSYRFTVTATLKEWNGTSWVTAVTKNQTPVMQTIVKNFRTGPPVAVSNVATHR